MDDNQEIINDVAKLFSQKPLVDKLDACKVFLFGSRAQGSNKTRSDIDIGIMGKEKIPSTVFCNRGCFG